MSLVVYRCFLITTAVFFFTCTAQAETGLASYYAVLVIAVK
jgi:hypothetical protein